MTAKTNDISHSRPWITAQDKLAVERLLSSEMLTRGELTRRFEEEVASYNACAGALSFSSATFAIAFALRALGASEGREVIVPTYVCESVIKAVEFTGASPVLCDVGENNWNITPESVHPHIGPKTTAIIVVHIFGIPANVDGIKALGIPVIEDCAQSFGTECDGEMVGSIGDIGIYSFHATKCLASGEGGMVVAKSREMLQRLHRTQEAMSAELLSPLSDMQAALGLSQLERYNEFLDRRLRTADFYFKNLPEEWTKRIASFKKGNIFFRFPLFGNFDFENIREEMNASGIQVRKGVDSLLHRRMKLDDKDFPNAVEALEKTLSIPCYPALTEDQAEKVCENLKRIIL